MCRRPNDGRQKVYWRGENMNYFFVIFLLCAVEPLRGRVVSTNRTDLLASVKEYPSFLHKCTATFIRPDTLVTSAHCLFCEGYCTLFVEAGAKYLSDRTSTPHLYSVNYTIIHPEYEPFPEQNDIGLIKLKESVLDAAIFDLPTGYIEPRGIEANTYEWKFSEDGSEFQLQNNPAIGVSNAMCSLALNQYVSAAHICALGKRVFSFGIYDNGSPLLGKYNGVWLLLGIYVRQGVFREVRIELFQSIVPYVAWINSELTRDPEKSSSAYIFNNIDNPHIIDPRLPNSHNNRPVPAHVPLLPGPPNVIPSHNLPLPNRVPQPPPPVRVPPAPTPVRVPPAHAPIRVPPAPAPVRVPPAPAPPVRVPPAPAPPVRVPPSPPIPSKVPTPTIDVPTIMNSNTDPMNDNADNGFRPPHWTSVSLQRG